MNKFRIAQEFADAREHAHSNTSRIRISHNDELLRVAHRQQPQQHLIHNAENCAVGSDSQGERNYCDQRKYWIAHELSEGITNISDSGIFPRGNSHASAFSCLAHRTRYELLRVDSSFLFFFSFAAFDGDRLAIV